MSSSIGTIHTVPTNSEWYLSTLAAVDTKLTVIEGHLTRFAVTPIVGTVTGLTKVLLGLVQTVSAVALSTIFLLGALFVADKKGALYCAAASALHILKGAKNVAIGLLEAIPVVGTHVALMQIKRRPGSLKVEANALTKDFGNGIMLKNSELCEKYGIFQRIITEKTGLCQAAYTISLRSSNESQITTMDFSDPASMRKILAEHITEQLTTSTDAVHLLSENSRTTFVAALANELFDEYAKLTSDEHSTLLYKSFSSGNDGYMYEINGLLDREYFPSSKDDETIRVQFDLRISAAFFSRLNA